MLRPRRARLPLRAPEDMWSLLGPHLTADELRRFTTDPALPPGPLAVLALEMKDGGIAGDARKALARRLERTEILEYLRTLPKPEPGRRRKRGRRG